MSCIPVSSASYISFSSTSLLVEQIATNRAHTCVLFTIKTTLCFGENTKGELGIDSIVNISGPAPPDHLLSSRPSISFSDNSIPLVSVHPGYMFTCVVRCDGKVMCWGNNASGQLGMGVSTAVYGDSANEISTLQPIAFDPLNIPTPPLCGTQLLSLKLSSGDVPNFSSTVTMYVFTVATMHAEVSVVEAIPDPPSSLVTVNNLAGTIWVPLDFNKLIKVHYLSIIIFHSFSFFVIIIIHFFLKKIFNLLIY